MWFRLSSRRFATLVAAVFVAAATALHAQLADSLPVLSLNTAGTRLILLDEQPLPLTASRKVALSVDAYAFFKDNEFVAEKAYGSTFPGFRFTPRLSYTPLATVAFEAGCNMLYFWGADQYPNGLYAPPAARYNSSSTPLLLTPWLRLRWDFNSNTHLVIGNLYNNRNHDLPLPLYNDEWSYVSRPEGGIQLLHEGQFLKGDLWVNWQRYLFFNDPQQEQILAGVSLRPLLLNHSDGWQLSVPLHLVAKHYGGEFTLPDQTPLSLANGAAGVTLRRNFKGALRHLSAEYYCMGYAQTNDSLSPFGQGNGQLATIAANYKGLLLSLSHWSSQGFTPILGSPHFSNVSTNFEGLTIDRMQISVVRIAYAQYRLPWAALCVEGSWIHYYPWTGDRPGYDKVIRTSSNSFSFGLSLRFMATKQ